MLQDVRSISRPFGGITVVFGGDFQQTLPVVVRGSRADIIFATIQRSEIWNKMKIFHLNQNMRLHSSLDSGSFANWLLDIGHGRSTDPDSSLTSIPNNMLCKTEDELIAAVYGTLSCSQTLPNPDFFSR
jgi:hypothetical protein